MRRAAALLFLAVIPASGCGLEGSGPSAPATPFGVGVRLEVFVDRARGTDPTPSAPGDEQPRRTLTTRVLYPERDGAPAAGRFPMVLFSHGFDATPRAYTALLSRWVAAGYVVVAPRFPLTNADIDERSAADLPQQPLDVSFVLTALVERASQPGHPLNGRLDPGRVVAAGHSLGGATTLGLFSACCHDERLDGGIVLAANDFGFGRQGFVASGSPLLFINGDRDALVAYGSGLAVYREVRGPRAFVTLEGADHLTPYFQPGSSWFTVVADVTLGFLSWTLREDRGALDALRRAADVHDVAGITDELDRPLRGRR